MEQAIREERLAGGVSRHAGQEASTLTPALEARILEWTLKHRPPDGATQWSTRRLGTQLKISHMMVARVWAKHGLKPQRLDRYMATQDPDFEQKAADMIGLYLNPPAHAAVFCVDEKTTIQRLTAGTVSPLSPGRADGMALSTSGTARCPCTRRSTPRPARYSARRRATHLCGVCRVPGGHRCQPAAWKRDPRDCRNLSAHKTGQVDDFLDRHPKVHLHFTPTYSSWLNQIELWFAKIERDVIRAACSSC